jgi:hypothetical protein
VNLVKNSMEVSGVNTEVSGVDLEVSDFCYPPETSFFFYPKFRVNNPGYLATGTLRSTKNLRNSYQNFGREETGEFYEVSGEKNECVRLSSMIQSLIRVHQYSKYK